LNSSSAKTITKGSKSSFLSSFKFLPAEKRKSIYSVYAWCRYTDDIADSNSSLSEKEKKMTAWSKELNKIYGGTPSHPVAVSLQETLRSFPIPKSVFEEMITAMWKDIRGEKLLTWDELFSYCHGVASTVGLMSIEIFGYSEPEARQYAEELGIALQLTNIMRDVKKDALNNRIYLPEELLNKYDIPPEELKNSSVSGNLYEMMREFSEVTEKRYANAEELLPLKDRKKLLPAIIMGRVYNRLYRKIQSNGFDVFSKNIRLSSMEKSIIAVITWLKETVSG
jgi:phytoene synthase